MSDRSEKVFASEEEAQSYALQYRRDYWAYDPIIRVYQRKTDGKWIADIDQRSSCD
jgi:hypothetical protein